MRNAGSAESAIFLAIGRYRWRLLNAERDHWRPTIATA
jgi:hypothetical protein